MVPVVYCRSPVTPFSDRFGPILYRGGDQGESLSITGRGIEAYDGGECVWQIAVLIFFGIQPVRSIPEANVVIAEFGR